MHRSAADLIGPTPILLLILAGCGVGPRCPDTQYLGKDGLCHSPPDTGAVDDTDSDTDSDTDTDTDTDSDTDSDTDTDTGTGTSGAEGGGGGYEQLDDEEGTGAGDDGWRPSGSIQLDCPWLPQVPPGEWEYTKNCGPTSLIMANACLAGTTPDYGDIIDTIEWMDAHISTYDGVGSNYNGSSTNTEELRQTSEELFGRDAERFSGVSLSDLWNELAAGRPVIVAIESQGTNNYPSDVMVAGSGHFALLVGLTPTHVILNDPGRGQSTNGENRAFIPLAPEKDRCQT